MAQDQLVSSKLEVSTEMQPIAFIDSNLPKGPT